MNLGGGLPIKVIGALSALVFAFSFGLETLALLEGSRSHQLLLSGFIVCLAMWAIVEAVLLGKTNESRYINQLILLLGFQVFLALFRAGMLTYPVVEIVNDGRVLVFFLSIYIILFLGISQTIINFHSAKLEEANYIVYQDQTRIAIQESKIAERERLIQDMHDGFGSQLATARMMAEHGSLKPDKLAELLQECISDLYLFTDTLGNDENTLADGLADLRFRTQQRCGHLPIKWIWHIELQALPTLSQKTSLQILRITQEAINNLLRHARASQVVVRAHFLPEEGLLMSVSDNGVGLPVEFREGSGFAGMRHRTREIGGRIDIERLDQETRVDLFLPLAALT
jgi:signal transduction histidine kinase